MRRCLLILMSVVTLTGCASLPEGHQGSDRDPWERFNRAVFAFNDEVDSAVLKPVAQGYRDYVPEVFQFMAKNFFGNLSDISTSANHALQGEFQMAANAAARVLFNSTLGFLGLGDPASELGFQKTKEDFGLTLGVWGADSGPYLVLPFLGPSSLRDGIGTGADLSTDPMRRVVDFPSGTRTGLTALRVVNTRAGLLSLESALDLMSFDRYSSVRDVYLARRAQQVNPDQSYSSIEQEPSP